MFIGAVIFLWLEAQPEQRRIEERFVCCQQAEIFTLLNYRKVKYNRELEQLVDRIRNISNGERSPSAGALRTSNRQIRDALATFHEHLDLSPQLEAEWSLTTALYFSGTSATLALRARVAAECF